MPDRMRANAFATLLGALLLAGCATPRPDRSSEGAAAPAVADAVGPSSAGGVVIAALNFLDRPYQSGGQSVETGFDCSGFTRHVFGQSLGIELPRTAQEQAQAAQLRPVARGALQAGDLVFFNTQRRSYSHVGIYVGDGRFIHAPRTGAQIRTESMVAAYWSRRYDGARRAVAFDTTDP